MTRISVEAKISDDVAELLRKLPIEIAGPIAEKALDAAADIVVERTRQLTPRGNPKHKPGKKPLYETIGKVSRKYGTIGMRVVGPQYPAGAHGHLVEGGHEKVLWGVRTNQKVSPHPFLQRAIDDTEQSVERAMIDVVEKAIDRLAK